MDSGTSGWRRRESSCGVGGIVGRCGCFEQIEENVTAMQDAQLISEGVLPVSEIVLSCCNSFPIRSLNRRIDAKTFVLTKLTTFKPATAHESHRHRVALRQLLFHCIHISSMRASKLLLQTELTAYP